MSKDRNKHLDCVLKSHKIANEESLLEKHRTNRVGVRELLAAKYGSKMYDSFDSGSYAKNTAVNTKFDFDLIAPFKRDTHNTLKEMYEEVYQILFDEYDKVATVRKQKVSIGIEFYPDEDGDIVNIDVVPGRELNPGQYEDDQKLNLYVYSRYGTISEGSERLRTNVKVQIENIRSNSEKGEARKVVRLLKVWKIENRKQVKSFFIELIVLKAFEKLSISGFTWEVLKSCLEFIRDKVETINLPDPGNGGNNVSDTLTANEKTNLSYDMKYMIDRIEGNSDNISHYFPVNTKFPCEEEDDKSKTYGGSPAVLTVPPTTRFG